MRPKVLLTRAYSASAVEVLQREFDVEIGGYEERSSPQELKGKIADKQAVISMLDNPIGADIMDAAPNLRIIANYAVGYNNVDVPHAISKGIFVTHTPGVLTDATADIAFALLITLARRIISAHRFTLDGKFKGWEPELMVGQDLCGKTVGIVGMGRIGEAFARRCRGFDMRVIYTKTKRLSVEEELRFGVSFRTLDALLSDSDFVSLHVPLTEKTHHLLDRQRLSLIKPNAILINTARGPIVDETALAEMLDQGRIWGAGFDVYEKEPYISQALLDSDRVVLLPHIGSATRGTRDKMAMMTIDALRACFAGKAPEFLVPEWKVHLSQSPQ